MRKNISTDTPSEKRVGYSRAVVINNRMYVSGTTAIDEEGGTVGGTVYEQATFVFGKIKDVLESQGFLPRMLLMYRFIWWICEALGG